MNIESASNFGRRDGGAKIVSWGCRGDVGHGAVERRVCFDLKNCLHQGTLHNSHLSRSLLQ
jgi:hypothetical protein